MTTSPKQLHTRHAALWALAVTAVLAPGSAGAQPFTDNIEIASHHPTLQAAIDAAGPFGMLIVDQEYAHLPPVVLPRPFRMVGMGIQGRAFLSFDLLAGSAVRVGAGPGPGLVEIENLDIEGLFTPGGRSTAAIGIDLTETHQVFLRNVTVRGFDVGVYGNSSESIHADNCNVSLNETDNYQLTNESNGWRIRGGISSQAGRYAVSIEDSNDVLIDGLRMESNTVAGVYANSFGAHIAFNRFECWDVPELPFCEPTTRAVVLGPDAEETTLVGNYYSGIALVDQSTARTTHGFDAAQTVTTHVPAGVEALRVRSGGITQLVVDGQGQLGVGTSVPTAQLQIQSSSGEDALLVRTFGSLTPRLLVDDQGFIGVGTSSPDERLHVEGDIKLNGNLVSDGEICIGNGC